jgi:hypothetical protein
VKPDPIAPSITKNPTDGTVCVGATVAASVTAFGTGGAGSCQDELRYSINGGGSWSAWSATIPSVVTTAAGTFLIESRRNCPASGCNSNVNSISWTVVADPVISTQPVSGTVCINDSYTLTVGASGGTGTFSYQWQESTTGCAGTFTNVGTNSTSYATTLLSAARYYKVLVSQSGNSCNTVTSNCVTVNIQSNLASSTWNGSVSTDWYNPANWSNCVPGNNTNAVVPAGMPRYPQIIITSPLYNGNATCKTINVANNASVTVKGNAVLDVLN